MRYFNSFAQRQVPAILVFAIGFAINAHADQLSSVSTYSQVDCSQLKGSGGSYGFERISTDAAELEKAVERIVKGDHAERLEEKIQQHVVNLRAEIDKRSREMNPTAA